MPAAVARWSSLMTAHATAKAVPPELGLGVLWTESWGDPEVGSNKGAVGLMQLMPGTALDYGVMDRTDPEESIRGGVAHLARLSRKFGGDWAATLAAYNWGEGYLQRNARWPAAGWLSRVPDETAKYVPTVLRRAGWTVRGELAVPPRGTPVPPQGRGGVPPAAAAIVGGGVLAAILAALAGK